MTFQGAETYRDHQPADTRGSCAYTPSWPISRPDGLSRSRPGTPRSRSTTLPFWQGSPRSNFLRASRNCVSRCALIRTTSGLPSARRFSPVPERDPWRPDEDLPKDDQTGAAVDCTSARALLTRRQWHFAERLVHDLRKAGNRVPPETYALDYYFGSRPASGRQAALVARPFPTRKHKIIQRRGLNQTPPLNPFLVGYRHHGSPSAEFGMRQRALC